jgi:ribonuclease G
LPEWLVEHGIGETRYALVEDGGILEAGIEVEGVAPAGSIVAARLVSGGSRNAVARDSRGKEYLLPNGAPGVSEGAALNVEITRSAIPGSEPWKRPLGRISREGRGDSTAIAARELTLPGRRDELAELGWNDLIEQARSGTVRFAGGELRISPTPAMTLIDVDGHLAPSELAVAGASEAARAIRRLDIGGSIGIDLPTAGSKQARHAAAAAIDAELPLPFERTAVNGFGFIQVVRPRCRASLVELAQDRAAFEARALMRRAAYEVPGPRRLAANAAVIRVLEEHPQWLDALARQLGGSVSLRADPNLPMSGGYAEKP